MRDDNHYQLQIPTLTLIPLSYHIQHSSNLYNKAQLHQVIKMRDDNPTLTTNPNTFTSYLCYIISNILQTFTTRHILIPPIPHQLNRESFFLNGLYNMETFCMVVLGGGICDDILLAPGGAYSLSKLLLSLG